MKTVIFLKDAEAEVETAQDFLDERQFGLGARFLASLQNSLGKISQRPAAFRVVDSCGARKALLNVFPYTVFFLAEDSVIVIVAVAHAKRRPFYWKERLDKK